MSYAGASPLREMLLLRFDATLADISARIQSAETFSVMPNACSFFARRGH